jgi:hypothetical protein
LLDGGRERLSVRTALGQQALLSYDQIAALRFARPADAAAEQLFAEALAARLPGADTLIALDGAEPKALRGRLVLLGPEEGRFVFNERERTFRTTRIYGLVLAAGKSKSAATQPEIVLDNGDRFRAGKIRVDPQGLSVATEFGSDWVVPLEHVCAVRMRSPRVVHLSALSAERETSTGILHPTWPIVRDANVLRGPLVLGGRTYAHGIGVHARAEIIWSLGGKYETFAATIGIDDAVGDHGSGDFQVFGDGRQLFASGPLSGRDAPRAIRVSIAGVDKLTLIVEPAGNADVGDWADWADARIILPQLTQ